MGVVLIRCVDCVYFEATEGGWRCKAGLKPRVPTPLSTFDCSRGKPKKLASQAFKP